MNDGIRISATIEKILCPGSIKDMYISEEERFLYIQVMGANKRKYNIVSESAWRIIDKEKEIVVIGEYDGYYFSLEDINKILSIIVNYCGDNDDHIDTISINAIGSLIIHTDKLLFEAFVSGCGDTINWKIDDVEESKSLCIMSSSVLYYEPEIVESI